MNRHHLVFECEGALLAATLDRPSGDRPSGAPAKTGLLIVSGGNEIRSGAGSASARLAANIAAAGFPVLRFDRRGVGDSEGLNFGFLGAEPDITEAIATLRKQARVARVVVFGNCDAASALMLVGAKLARPLGADALVLTNPWTLEGNGENMANDAGAAVLRAHYRRRLRNPAALWRLITGGVALRGLAQGLVDAARPTSAPGALARGMADGLARFAGPVRILLAGRDRTADAFLAQWNRTDPRLHHCPAAGHGFVEAEAAEWLEGQLLEVLSG